MKSVCRGSCDYKYEKREDVAVKRILDDNETLAEREIKNLLNLEEDGKNVIR